MEGALIVCAIVGGWLAFGWMASRGPKLPKEMRDDVS